MALDPFTAFRYWLARGLVKAAALPVVAPWVRASFLEPTWQALVREGYQANGAVFACVSALAFAYPEPAMLVYDADDEALPDHPLRARLRRPNPLMGESEMAAYTVVYQALGGNAYWYKVRSRAGKVVELWPYHAGQMRPVPGGDNWIDHYEYDPYSAGQVIEVAPEDIVHFKWPTPDPTQPWMAMPPLRAVARDADSDNELTRYLFALLKNDAVPRTALVLPPSVTLNDKQYDRLKTQWNERYGGENRGSMGIVEGGATVQRIGLDLRELEFEPLHGVPEARIAAAFRTPPIVAGLNIGLQRGTFANYAEARRAWTEQTLVPLWTMAAGEIESSLADEFGAEGELRVAPNLSQVKALTEDETARWTRVTAALQAGGITVNEYRRALGYPEDSGGDVYLRGLAVVVEPAKVKALPPPRAAKRISRERRQAAVAVGAALQRTRRAVAGRMEAALDAYFRTLAERAAARAKKSWNGHVAQPGGGLALEVKLRAEDLITPADGAELETLVKRFNIEIVSASWETWNLALGVEAAFDLADPAVARVLTGAGTRIKGIQATTLEAVRDLLQHGASEGWSVDQIVRGVEGQPGLRDIVEQTYRGRARTIARTELGTAQNLVAAGRYAALGVTHVLVLDNGDADDDEACRALNGTVQTVQWAQENPLAHPNCTRATSPIVEA